MIKSVLVLCLASLAVTAKASPTPEPRPSEVGSVHIIRPPVRCPEGYKPDAKGRCRKVFERAAEICSDGEEPDERGTCEEKRALEIGSPDDDNSICPEGEDCSIEARRQKRGSGDEVDDSTTRKPRKRMKKSKSRRSKSEDGEGAARSKHLIFLLKKKKKELLKPKPPQHHPHPEPEEPAPTEDGPQTFRPEEDPPEPPQTLFFGDEACVGRENQSELCRPDPEIVETVQANKEFKEWNPPKSSESSDSSESSSSSSDSESEPASGETEDEILERAIRIKLEKILRMKQRYGPALRRWLVERLREYEDRKEKKEIISTRCLEAVKETMEVIKDNLEVEGLFTTSGNLRTRKKIQSYLSRGDIYTLRNWGFEFVVECAAALKIFLQNLPQPLIPLRIQQLVVAENSGIPEKTIANDALGLLKEEVNGRHKELLLEVFTFLKEAAVKVNTSELTGCNLPLKLLPVFFEIESNNPQKFRDIATVFHEIIMEAPDHLKSPHRKIPSGELKILERILSQDMRMPSIPLINARNGRNQPTGENAEWRIPVPRVPHTRLHPWLGRVEHSAT